MKRVVIIVIAVLGLGAAVAGMMYWKSAKGVPAERLEAEYLTAADRFVEVAGARVRVREEGPDDAPVVVLVHGFTMSLESWDDWAHALSQDYRVIRYDLLGHGLTGPDPQTRYAPEARAAFLIELLNILEIERAHFAGNSLGGTIAWRLAAAAPERVERLVLISPAAYPFNGVADEPVEAPKAVELFYRTAPAEAVRAALDMIYGAEQVDDARVEVMRDMMRREGNGGAYIEHLAQFTLPDASAQLAKVAAPTLILWGAQDALIPPAHGTRLQAELSDARLIEYPDLGHAAHEEDPERTLADVLVFLAENAEPVL